MNSRHIVLFLFIAAIMATTRSYADGSSGWAMGIWDVDLTTTSRVMKEKVKAESDNPEILALMDGLIDSLMLQLKGTSLEITPSHAKITGLGKNSEDSYESIQYRDDKCIITGTKGDVTTLYKADTGLWIYSDDKAKKVFFSKRKAD